jgi:hypothetical protein
MLFYLVSKILYARNFSGIFFAAAVGMLGMQTAFGSNLYLALVGPPPMRYEVEAPKDPVFMAELALPSSEPTNEPDVAASSAGTNAPVANASVPKFPMQSTGPVTYTATAGIAAPPVVPASNLLIANPWMITQYLTPYLNNNGAATGVGPYQPGDAIFVPEESGFVPPMPGSRATYHSQ